MSGKWLELLKEIAPRVMRAAVLRDPAIASGIGQFAGVQAVASSLGVELSPVDVRDADEIERAITAFARSGNGGLIVTASTLATRHRDLIITLAARHKLPAVYGGRHLATPGGLLSYGPDYVDPVPSSGRLRRSCPQGRETGRPAGAVCDQVRDGDQPQDRQGARARRAAVRACARRRGNRIRLVNGSSKQTSAMYKNRFGVPHSGPNGRDRSYPAGRFDFRPNESGKFLWCV